MKAQGNMEINLYNYSLMIHILIEILQNNFVGSQECSSNAGVWLGTRGLNSALLY